LDGNVYLSRTFQRVPVDCYGIVGNFLYAAYKAYAVLGIGVEYPLLDAVLPTVPEVPSLYLVLWTLLFSKHQHHDTLNSLRLERLVRVWDVLHGDAVELALVDVSDAVILAPLVGGDGRLQVVAEPVLVVHFWYLYLVSVALSAKVVPRAAAGAGGGGGGAGGAL